MTAPILEPTPGDPRRKHVDPILKLLLELGPLAVFFLANARGAWFIGKFPALGALGGPIFLATASFMAATALSLLVSWIVLRTLPIVPLASGVVVFAFGALTLWLHDETFIKMKPTVINALFGAVLLGGLALGKPLLGYVFDQAFTLNAEGWRRLTFRWGFFFLFLAVLNEIVWRNVSTDHWVLFKVWATMPITLLFTVAQLPLLMRHSVADEPKPK